LILEIYSMADPASKAPAPTPDINPEATTVMPESAAALIELEQLRVKLAESEERAKNHWSEYLRAVAEQENIRKRAQKDIESTQRYGVEKFLAEVLPVKDSLDLGVENSDKADVAALKEGQLATQRLLTKALQKVGVVELNPVGQPFDAHQHEAIMAQESSTAEPNSVLVVVQRGYSLHGRLLRPARVVVAKAPLASPS
jgi:molecular chaperone GrpE